MLAEHLGCVGHRPHGEPEESLHGLLVADVEVVTLGIGRGNLVGEHALPREFQVGILLLHGGLECSHLGCGLGAHGPVALGTCQEVAHVGEMCAVVHAPQVNV